MMPRKISQPVCAVSLELLTAASNVYGLTGVSPSGAPRAKSVIPGTLDKMRLETCDNIQGESVSRRPRLGAATCSAIVVPLVRATHAARILLEPQALALPARAMEVNRSFGART